MVKGKMERTAHSAAQKVGFEFEGYKVKPKASTPTPVKKVDK